LFDAVAPSVWRLAIDRTDVVKAAIIITVSFAKWLFLNETIAANIY
jgi:hypothetical protein